MSSTLKAAFSSGVLTHPLEGEANSVELFRTIPILSGIRFFEETQRIEKLRTRVGAYDHYLFVLVDGLGMNLRRRFPAGGFLSTNLATEIRSVFPSTTAVALTSQATGRWPAEHGLTGWWTHFPEYRRVICPLLFVERGTQVPAENLGLSVRDLVSVDAIQGSFFRDPVSFLPQHVSHGHYANWSRAGTRIVPFRTHRQLVGQIRKTIRAARGPSYNYLYLLTVDSLCHKYGTESPEVAEEVARVDRLLGRLRSTLPQTVRIIVTADHGLVDVPPERYFTFGDEHPIAAHLIGGQTGEARAPVFHVRPGHDNAFRDAFAEMRASRFFTLHTPAELAECGVYGPAPLSDAARLHLGEYVGLSTEPARLEYVGPGMAPVPHVGVHGGLSPQEIQVPLCLA